jgi:selenium metabolism protein YedF
MVNQPQSAEGSKRILSRHTTKAGNDMAHEVVDARGQLCPKPLIMTKKALSGIAEGDSLTIQIDNATSLENVRRFLTDNGMSPAVAERAGVYELKVIKKSAGLAHPDAASYCTSSPAKPPVVCLKGDTMGFGDLQLGEILIKAFINTLENVSPLPSTIVCYNRGVFLALKDSPVREALTELSGKGVRILVCGTCLDFYKQKEHVAVGVVSNMYDIAEALLSAGHVVCP